MKKILEVLEIMKYSITLFPKRAQQTLKLLCDGKEKQEIMEELALKPDTYKKYLCYFRNYFQKKEIHAIVVICLRSNLFRDTASFTLEPTQSLTDFS